MAQLRNMQPHNSLIVAYVILLFGPLRVAFAHWIANTYR